VAVHDTLAVVAHTGTNRLSFFRRNSTGQWPLIHTIATTPSPITGECAWRQPVARACVSCRNMSLVLLLSSRLLPSAPRACLTRPFFYNVPLFFSCTGVALSVDITLSKIYAATCQNNGPCAIYTNDQALTAPTSWTTTAIAKAGANNNAFGSVFALSSGAFFVGAPSAKSGSSQNGLGAYCVQGLRSSSHLSIIIYILKPSRSYSASCIL
jgi:hypothetical protein